MSVIKEDGRAVVVTSAHRDIVYGHIVEISEGGNCVKLERARHVNYFGYREADNTHRGLFSLATLGPTADSRIGPEVTLKIRDVVMVIDCTDEAQEAWRIASWGK